MTVLNYLIKENVAGQHSFLEHLKNFAVSVGWTQIYYHPNSQWKSVGGGLYNFVEDSTDTNLALESVGYGNQVLHFRLKAGPADVTYTNHAWLLLSAFKSGTQAINYSSATHPVDLSYWNDNTRRYTSLPANTTIPKVFYFGNSKFILAVIQASSTHCFFVTFGSMELFDINEDEGNFVGASYNSITLPSALWTNRNQFMPFDSLDKAILYNNTAVIKTDTTSTNYVACNIMFLQGSDTWDADGFSFNRLFNSINSFSTVRPIAKPAVTIRHSSDMIFRPLGYFPIFRIRHENLAMGEILQYGASKYYTFPNVRLGERFMGIAVRVA